MKCLLQHIPIALKKIPIWFSIPLSAYYNTFQYPPTTFQYLSQILLLSKLGGKDWQFCCLFVFSAKVWISRTILKDIISNNKISNFSVLLIIHILKGMICLHCQRGFFLSYRWFENLLETVVITFVSSGMHILNEDIVISQWVLLLIRHNLAETWPCRAWIVNIEYQLRYFEHINKHKSF